MASPQQDVDNNLCLSLHQPWASLLVQGIKTSEGRMWSTDHRGKLWIHAASKQPDEMEVKSIEEQYRLLNPDVDFVFPKDYPLGALVGRVEVTDCLPQEVYSKTDEANRDPNDNDFLWLCVNPERLLLPIQIQGQKKLWHLPKDTAAAAVKALKPVKQRVTGR